MPNTIGNKILICMRHDANTKNGGDLFILKMIADVFIKKGCLVDFSTSLFPDLNGYVAIYCANLDRHFEAYIHMKRAKKHNIKFYIYTLHHPDLAVHRYLKYGVTSKKMVVSFFSLFKPSVYESIKGLLGLITVYPGLIFWPKAFLGNKTRRDILKGATCCLVACDLEMEHILKDCNVPPIQNYCKVPHVLTSDSIEKTVHEKESKLVVCAARHEERKNQLKVFDLAKKHNDYKFVFVGGRNENDRKFQIRFDELIKENNNCYYLGEVSLQELTQVIRKASIFISASWFEVLSLVELQAFISGCQMVVGKGSYVSEYFGECAQYHDGTEASLNDAFSKVLLSKINIDEYLVRSSIVKKEMSNDNFESSLCNCIKEVSQ
jgi:hypothetical protein